MCKIIYLTSRRFDYASRHFCNLLQQELRKRNLEVVYKPRNDVFNIFRTHKIYGIALGIDFYNDGGSGSGLTLNKRCSNIGRQFAYRLLILWIKSGISFLIRLVLQRKQYFICVQKIMNMNTKHL